MSDTKLKKIIKMLKRPLLTILIFIILLWAMKAFGAVGGYIDLESVSFYTDNEEKVRVRFDVDITFSITYYLKYGKCVVINYDVDPEEWNAYSIFSDNFKQNPYQYNWAFFISSLETHSTCPEYSETYTAGNTYDTYLFILRDRKKEDIIGSAFIRAIILYPRGHSVDSGFCCRPLRFAKARQA